MYRDEDKEEDEDSTGHDRRKHGSGAVTTTLDRLTATSVYSHRFGFWAHAHPSTRIIDSLAILRHTKKAAHYRRLRLWVIHSEKE